MKKTDIIFILKRKLNFIKENFNRVSLKFDKNSVILFSIIVSVLGLFFLFILSFYIKPQFVNLTSIKEIKEGSFIKTFGFVSGIEESRFRLCDSLKRDKESCIIVLVQQGRVPEGLLENDKVYVTGSVRKLNNNIYLWVRDKNDIEIYR